MSEADKLYFEALSAIKAAAGQRIGQLSSNSQRVAAAKADINDALAAHGVDLIIQALIVDLQEDVELRKKVGVEHRIAEKKLELLSKALYCSIRNADKPTTEVDAFEELDE